MRWFWAHRRNSSILHMSMLLEGFRSKGFLPAVDFYFKKQIVVRLPKKGCYLFYDKDEIDRKSRDILKSILGNKRFVEDFNSVHDRIFDELLAFSNKIEETDLSALKDDELMEMISEFRRIVAAGPLITVQLWGIEACWHDSSALKIEVEDKAEDLEQIKVRLSPTTGKSVAFSERESFLKTLIEIQKKGIDDLAARSRILKHISDFGWVNSEYVSGKKSEKQWKQFFIDEVGKDAESELRKLREEHKKLLNERRSIVDQLNLGDDARRILDALDAFTAQRDWAKGKFCYALDRFNLLLDEISIRKRIDKEHLLNLTIGEMIKEPKIAIDRMAGAVLVSSDEGMDVDTDVAGVVKKHRLESFFENVIPVDEFKGVIASRGRAIGKARVIESSSEIESFRQGEILVTYMTTMEFTPLFSKAGAIITDEGGLSSHAAIISREFGIPCIVGTTIATRTIKTGDLIELDADNGVVRILQRA